MSTRSAAVTTWPQTAHRPSQPVRAFGLEWPPPPATPCSCRRQTLKQPDRVRSERLAMAPQWSERLIWVTEPLHAEARRPHWASSAVARCATFPRTPHTPPLAAAQKPLGASLATDPLARQAVYHGWSGCPGHGVGPFSVVGRGFRFASEPDPVGAAPQRTSHRDMPQSPSNSRSEHQLSNPRV